MNRLQRLGAVLGLLGLLVLTACAADGDPAAEPTPPGGGGGTPAASPDPSEDASGDPAPDPAEGTASVAPATGPLLRGRGASIRVPEGFDAVEPLPGTWSASRGLVNIGFVEVTPVSFRGLEELLEVTGTSAFRGRTRVRFDAEVGGEPAYLVTGRDRIGPRLQYGALRGDTAVTLSFVLTDDLSPAERTRLVDSVLATFAWS